jgi:Rod binding domain-containing protein
MSDISLASLPAPALTTNDAGIARSARDFATIVYTELLAPMMQTADTSDSEFGGGSAERSLQPLWLGEIAKAMAANDDNGGGLKITQMIAAQLAQMQISQKPHSK